MREKIKRAIEFVAIILVFVLVSYLIQTNLEFIKNYLDQGILSTVVYVLLLFIATIFAPITVMPLFPIASSLWGVIPTTLLSVFGWVAGAMVAFFLARRYGIPLVEKLFSVEQIDKYQKRMPQENLLVGLIFFRVALPFDIFNYLFGLFKHIKTRTFFFATLISYSFYAFAFSYIGSLPWQWQIIAFFVGAIIVVVSWKIYTKTNKKH